MQKLQKNFLIWCEYYYISLFYDSKLLFVSIIIFDMLLSINMTTLKQIQDTLAEMGELMLMTDTGEKFEVHKHNTQFDEKKDVIKIDAASETFWLNPAKISYYWIHREGKENN